MRGSWSSACGAGWPSTGRRSSMSPRQSPKPRISPRSLHRTEHSGRRSLTMPSRGYAGDGHRGSVPCGPSGCAAARRGSCCKHNGREQVMHNIAIRGGTILDGTGAAAFTGDLAIDGATIAQVGGKAGAARREIDASGLLLTPGWVDVHTHYDGQATWDPVLAPSSWHGVTTILFGNCGVGFAPVRREHRAGLIDLMEAIEDIPGTALAEGLKWDWESFPEYLDALDRIPPTIDIGAQIPHHPLRVFVMGDRGIDREAATAEDIAEMRRLTEEALRAGAFGFTTSRTYSHKTNAGDLVPGHFAEEAELYSIGQAMAAVGSGAFGMNSDFVDEDAEFAWIARLSKETGRPVWFLLTDRTRDPARWKRLMKGVHAARAQGAQITAQVAGRPIGLIMGIASSFNPFSIRPSYVALDALLPQERLHRMRDPEMRRQLLSEEPSERQLARLSQARQDMVGRWDRMYVMAGATPDYEPTPEKSIAAIAASGQDADQRDRGLLRVRRPRQAQAGAPRRRQPDRF